MSQKGALDPGELDLITAVIDDVCRAEDVEAGSLRDRIARKAIEFYGSGIRRPGELRDALLTWRETDTD